MTRKYMLTLGAVALVPAAAHAQTAPAPGRTPMAATGAPAAAAAPTVGATILDSAGATIGTVDSVTPQSIVINTGTAKVAVPPASVGKTATGFALSITKDQLMAAQAQASAQAGAAVKSKLVAGTPVTGLQGAALGTIKSSDATTVTMTTTKNIDVKLPVSGFGAGPTGGVVLGMTLAQLDAATAGAKPNTTPASTAGTTPADPAATTTDAAGATDGAAAPASDDGTTTTAGTAPVAATSTQTTTTSKKTTRTKR